MNRHRHRQPPAGVSCLHVRTPLTLLSFVTLALFKLFCRFSNDSKDSNLKFIEFESWSLEAIFFAMALLYFGFCFSISIWTLFFCICFRKGYFYSSVQQIKNNNKNVLFFFSGTTCAVCLTSIPFRLGKQAYICRDCQFVCHKPCHIKVPDHCMETSLPKMEL